MSNFLRKIAASGIGGFAQSIANIVDQFTMDKEEKAQFTLALEDLEQRATSELEQTMREELGAKERIMVAELQQGDKYTKRARPTLIYAGMAVIAWNYCIIPVVGWAILQYSTGYVEPLPPLPLPEPFWLAWGGAVGVWSLGRSMERRGASSNLISTITGNKARDSVSDRTSLLD